MKPKVEQKLQRPALPEAEACTLVIFGASGDLTRRKLIPALYDLCGVGCMNARFEVVGTGRTRMTDEEFRESMKEAAKSSKDVRGFNEEKWTRFAKRLRYIVGDPASAISTPSCARAWSRCSVMVRVPNVLFYVSTPASFAGAMSQVCNRPDLVGVRGAGRESFFKSLLAAISIVPRPQRNCP